MQYPQNLAQLFASLQGTLGQQAPGSDPRVSADSNPSTGVDLTQLAAFPKGLGLDLSGGYGGSGYDNHGDPRVSADSNPQTGIDLTQLAAFPNGLGLDLSGGAGSSQPPVQVAQQNAQAAAYTNDGSNPGGMDPLRQKALQAIMGQLQPMDMSGLQGAQDQAAQNTSMANLGSPMRQFAAIPYGGAMNPAQYLDAQLMARGQVDKENQQRIAQANQPITNFMQQLQAQKQQEMQQAQAAANASRMLNEQRQEDFNKAQEAHMKEQERETEEQRAYERSENERKAAADKAKEAQAAREENRRMKLAEGTLAVDRARTNLMREKAAGGPGKVLQSADERAMAARATAHQLASNLQDFAEKAVDHGAPMDDVYYSKQRHLLAVALASASNPRGTPQVEAIKAVESGLPTWAGLEADKRLHTHNIANGYDAVRSEARVGYRNQLNGFSSQFDTRKQEAQQMEMIQREVDHGWLKAVPDKNTGKWIAAVDGDVYEVNPPKGAK